MAEPARYFEAEGNHEGIIHKTTFYQAQEKLRRIKSISATKRPSSAVYFCGTLYCSLCGGKMTTKWNYTVKENGKSKAHYPNYICSNVVRGLCKSGAMSHAKVERVFEEYIAEIADFTEIEDVDMTDIGTQTEHHEEMKTIIVEIEKTEKKSDELMRLFVQNAIDFNHYQDMAKLNKDRQMELQARLSLLQNAQMKDRYSCAITKVAANIRENWIALDNAQRLQFMHKFVRRVLVHCESPGDHKRNRIVIDEVSFNKF